MTLEELEQIDKVKAMVQTLIICTEKIRLRQYNYLGDMRTSAPKDLILLNIDLLKRLETMICHLNACNTVKF